MPPAWASSPTSSVVSPSTVSSDSDSRRTLWAVGASRRASSAAAGVRTRTTVWELPAMTWPIGASATSRPRPITTRWSVVSSISLIRWLETNADPADPVGVQPVDGLVEQHDAGVAEQRGGDPQPLAHPQRVRSGPPSGDLVQADQAEDLLHPGPGDPVAHRQGEQVAAGAAARMDRPGVQQRPHDPEGRTELLVGAAVDQRLPGGGPVKAEDHPHRGGLAGAVRAQEPGHLAGLHLERQVVDGEGGGRTAWS